jgi:hypothetical protein
MEFGYSNITDKLILQDIEELPTLEQNERLKQELESLIFEKQELLRHITFLQSQINKYAQLL